MRIIKVVFVTNLLLFGCTQIDDGRTRATNAEPNQSASSLQNSNTNSHTDNTSEPEIAIEGEKLQIVYKVLAAFNTDKDIPEYKKDLSRYRLEFENKEQDYYIRLIVLRDPDQSYVGGETDEGKDVVYRVDKRNGRIIERAFPK